MSTNTDETTWQTFKRLWQFIRLYKSGLIVAVLALVINAISDTYMISLLKPLLDEGFGNAESDFLRTLPLIIFAMMFIRGISGFVSTY
ncbi:lipid ABC transporter permease/ATP-binding protein, partial [Vibrio splendidus]